MGDDRLAQDLFVCNEQLRIVEKYEDFHDFMYKVILNIPRQHAVIRDIFMTAMLDLPRIVIEAGKSSQISKLYAADAALAFLRYNLRFMAKNPRRLISKDQCRVAMIHLAEVGKMLGAWIKTEKAKKG